MTAPTFAAPLSADRALDVVDGAVKASAADDVEITLLGRAAEYTRFVGNRIHQPQDITELQVMVRAMVDGSAGRAATSCLTHIPETVATATELARKLARTERPPAGAQVGRPTPAADPDLWHADTAAFDAPARVAVAATAMRAARAAGGRAAGMIGRAATQIAVATSTGIRRHTVATEATGSLTVDVEGGTSHWADLHRASSVLNVDDAIERTVRRATLGRGRTALPAGHYTVVLGPQAVGELLGFLGAVGFSGELTVAGVGLCATRPGECVVANTITVADDATAEVGLPIPFDFEGTPKRRVPFFTAGVVGQPVTDNATAAALGGKSTGHAHIAREEVPAPVAANVVMAGGRYTEDELIAAVDDGVYIERFWYTRLVDRRTGTITGVSRDGCFLIRYGVLGQPVAGARFTQSVLDFLSTVDAVARERHSQPVMNVWNGAVSAPALRGTGFRFGVRPVGKEGP